MAVLISTLTDPRAHQLVGAAGPDVLPPALMRLDEAKRACDEEERCMAFTFEVPSPFGFPQRFS
jgi:hypothetical protein